MKLEIWSDVVCPWCWIGKRRVERALAAFPHRDQVEVTWRSFLLDPGATSDGRPVNERLAEKYGVSLAEADAMNARVTAIAAQDGLDYHLDRAVSASTVNAHRLLHLATERGRGEELQENLFDAYFSRGVDLGEDEALVRLAVDAGLDADEVRSLLAGDAYADAVRADLAQARAYGISGVPFVVLDGRLGVSGAQPVEVFAEALAQAWSHAHPLVSVASSAGSPGAREGDACDDGHCAV